MRHGVRVKTSHRNSDDLNLVEITRRFPDDATARAFLESLRWPNGPVCPHCGVVNNAYRIAPNMGKKVRPGLYQCREDKCGKQFTVTVGTVFEASKVSLSNWLIAWHLVCASKKGIAALELQRLLGIGSYRTAWFMLMRIRESMKASPFAAPLGGTVEADATFVGGKARASRKYRDKKAVISMVERDGRAVSVVADREDRATVDPILRAHVAPTATLMTDEAHAYRTPGKAFAGHYAVGHTRGEFVRGRAHSNTAESFFALVKRGHYGTWHKVSKKYLPRYMAEFDYRWSNRRISDGSRTAKSLRDVDGKRLKLTDLRAKG